MPKPSTALEVFIAYAHDDETLKDELIKHLSPLHRQGLIDNWHDRRIEPGADWGREIDKHLNRRQIILLLISADFINSDYCFGIEMTRALERHDQGDSVVIPVILRRCLWTGMSFARLQALPKDGEAVTSWPDRDDAFANIAEGVQAVARRISKEGEDGRQAPSLPQVPRTPRQTGAARKAGPSPVLTASPRALIWNRQSNIVAYVPVDECEWGNDKATMVVKPDDSSDGPFLDGLRDEFTSLLVVYRNSIGACRAENVTHLSKAATDRWKLNLRLERSDFQPPMEVSMENLTADQIAERRARRILFNESPAKDEQDPNDVLLETFVSGSDTEIEVKHSTLPALFAQFDADPVRFLETGWIDTVMRLKLSGCVVEIIELRMELDARVLRIRFRGRRRKQYANQPAYEMKLNGECRLSDN